MAEDGAGQVPDLQAILATLANFAPPAQQDHIAPIRADGSTHEGAVSASALLKASDPRVRPQRSTTVSPKPVVDPASITTWQDGLRCVTKIAAQNAQFAASIRKMMDNQRQNEMRWYSERQAVKQGQARREKASAQASEILKGLSGASDLGSGNDVSSVSLEKELATFDRKIYAAQRQMDAAMTEELKGLGVPFFGTDASVIVSEGVRKDDVQATRPKHSPLVTESELLELRRRMVEHLEALYRD